MFRIKTTLKTLPLPPLELRRLVGPIRDTFYDNPTGRPIYEDVPLKNYRSVLDFGCGCGRLARQLIQQTPQPEQYLGLDIHRGMVTWCQQNLTPSAPQFRFEHQDVFNPGLNPSARNRFAPLPAPDNSFTLAIAHSVFTHLLEDQVVLYLKEIARTLTPDGVLVASWFLFDKAAFPMLAESQQCLFINLDDPTNAVFYDKKWLKNTADQAGLALTRIDKPSMRGFHWFIRLQRKVTGVASAEFPEDDAPIGTVVP